MTFSLSVQGAGVAHERRKEWGDDPTPRAMPRAIFGESMPMIISVAELNAGHARIAVFTGNDIEHFDISAERPYRVLDLHAGFGCWASEFARWWVHELELPREWLNITAVEVNEGRRAHLAKWCDHTWLMCWRALLEAKHRFGAPRYDLIFGNPDFAHILRSGKLYDADTERWKHSKFRDPGDTMVPTLRKHAPAVLLFHRAAAFEDSPFARDEYRANLPAAEWKCGRVSFDGSSSTDNSAYRATLWLEDHDGPCSAYMLPEPPVRRWYKGKPPGGELPFEAVHQGLPLAPGYSSEGS